MQKIVPHLWFDTEAKEATAVYASLLPDSKVNSVNTITGTPSGDTDIVAFTLTGKKFMAISAGPYFKINPSISMFVTFKEEEAIQKVWDALADGGKVLMPLQAYPWAKKYGWLQDKFGLSWQLSMSEHHEMAQRITPMMMFTQDKAGKTKEAIDFYCSVFPHSKSEMQVSYEKGEGDVEGYIKHSRFTLSSEHFMAMDSSAPHDFTFNEAISFIVYCDSQEEIDFFWSKLSSVPASERCGWCKDKYGVSWQIVPTIMNEMMGKGSNEQRDRVTQAFLKMKKFDISKLEAAYNA